MVVDDKGKFHDDNFNKAMATAADLVIAEVEEIVPVGEIAPEFVHTQGCFVDYLVQATLTLEDLGTSASVSSSKKVVLALNITLLI